MNDNAPNVLLRSEQSDGHVAIVELDGELTFQLAEDVFTRRAGDLAFAPRGVPHTYANLSGAPARALLVITPAGFERYFDRIAARISGGEPPPEAAGPIPEVVTLGPPLGKEETRS